MTFWSSWRPTEVKCSKLWSMATKLCQITDDDVNTFIGVKSQQVKCGKLRSVATTFGQKYCSYKLRMTMTFVEVTNCHKGWPTSRFRKYIKHDTKVLNLKFSVLLIVSMLTLLIVKLGGESGHIITQYRVILWWRKCKSFVLNLTNHCPGQGEKRILSPHCHYIIICS